MARTNLTKKDLINAVYMQLGFSKQIAENLIDDFLLTLITNLKSEQKLKISNFGTFSIRNKKKKSRKKSQNQRRKNYKRKKCCFI